nr:cobalt-precorrin 5A hydrolase [uncultured Niameybacter sp.]
MNIARISFTPKGAKVNLSLSKSLKGKGFHLSQFKEEGLENINTSLRDWVKEVFETYDAIIFIGATGIAIRAIAPFLVDKRQDPAVVVVDEKGRYVIPLVSGHIGGANQLAREVGKLLGALPIVTTATDIEGCFSVDEWANNKGFKFKNFKVAKSISAHLLQGKKIGLLSEFGVEGHLPEGLVDICNEQEEVLELGIWIGTTSRVPFKETLWLVPPIITLGIGCRKGVSKLQIDQLVGRELDKLHIPMEAIKQIVSIDLKANEEGLLEWSKIYKKPITFYTGEVLSQVEGKFTPSAFVEKITGVDNVCERAAVKGSNGGRLILNKIALEGVTMALAIENYIVNF